MAWKKLSTSLLSTGLTDVSPLATEEVGKWTLMYHHTLKKANLSKITTYEYFNARENNDNLTIDLSGVTAAGTTNFYSPKEIKLDSLETTTDELFIYGLNSPNLTFPALRHASGINMEFDIESSTSPFSRLFTAI